nr:MAG TPA: hypothetical protein [Caudoviricetes sp.]
MPLQFFYPSYRLLSLIPSTLSVWALALCTPPFFNLFSPYSLSLNYIISTSRSTYKSSSSKPSGVSQYSYFPFVIQLTISHSFYFYIK